MEEQIARLANHAIAQRAFPGCIVGVVDANGARIVPFGRETYDSEAPVITEVSLYDGASLTKSVITATLALQLMDEGKMLLESHLVEFVPEYVTRHRDKVTISHLLTYTLGNSLPLSRAGVTPERIFAAVCHEETESPGTVFRYSNTPAFLLGQVIERILGVSLAAAAQGRIFASRGMTSSTFRPHGAVPTEEGIANIVHDESARVFAQAGKVVGHAGLFLNMPDLLRFLTSLLSAPDMRLATNHISHLNASAALGWELNQPWMGAHRTSGTFGKTGFTGCSVVCDFERAVGVAILSNRTYPRRPPDRSAIDGFRQAVCDIVLT